MLVQYFKKPSRIKELRDGPGGRLLEGLAQELCQGRYSEVAARKHIRVAEHLIHWTGRQGLAITALEERLAEEFIYHLKRCRCPGYGPPQKLDWQKYRVQFFFGYLRRAGILVAPAAGEPVLEPALLTVFGDWMRQQRGAADVTLYIYKFYLRALLKRLGEDPGSFEARTLRQFVLETSQRSGNASARKCIAAVRMFLRFLISEGKCAAGLYASIPTLANWRLSALPRYLQTDEVERIIASCDLATSVGRRDRAILLLLARLGLRAGDIRQLRLGDLDWKDGLIRVSGKGRRQTVLPLTQEIGDAIVTYIKDDRPQTETDTLFVRSCAPFRAFASSSAVSVLVARAMLRAGVSCPNGGAAHVLRHSVASSMLRQGASLQEISVMLRHRSIETTEVYAKVDVVALGEIAQPWPGVKSC